jgi:hypothetical protein
MHEAGIAGLDVAVDIVTKRRGYEKEPCILDDFDLVVVPSRDW